MTEAWKRLKGGEGVRERNKGDERVKGPGNVYQSAKRKGRKERATSVWQPVVEARLLHHMHMNIARDLQGC